MNRYNMYRVIGMIYACQGVKVRIILAINFVMHFFRGPFTTKKNPITEISPYFLRSDR